MAASNVMIKEPLKMIQLLTKLAGMIIRHLYLRYGFMRLSRSSLGTKCAMLLQDMILQYLCWFNYEQTKNHSFVSLVMN